MSVECVNHDQELRRLISEFAELNDKIESFKGMFVKYKASKVMALRREKDKILDSICKTIKYSTPQTQKEIKDSLQDKFSLYLP